MVARSVVDPLSKDTAVALACARWGPTYHSVASIEEMTVSEYARAIGRRGGRRKTAKKAAQCAINGLKNTGPKAETFIRKIVEQVIQERSQTHQ